MQQISSLKQQIAECRLCADRFLATQTSHKPRPVVWFSSGARILIAGQAPGARVHESGKPFTDRSGDRLREWLGLSTTEFYDRERVAIVPMAFCFPGYDRSGSDLPPPRICAETWHQQVMQSLPAVALRILVGGHAHRWHLGGSHSVTEVVRQGPRRDAGGEVFALPHPSWRNTAWLKRNPWFEAELLPDLRARVKELMHDD